MPSSKFGLSQRDLDVEVRVLAAGVLSSAGRSSRARQVALSSLNAMRDRSGFNKGTLCNILSYSEAVLGDVPAIRAASRLGYENHNRAKSIFGITYSELLTAFADYEAGDPFKAEHHLRQGRDFVQASLGKGSYAEALLSIVESQIKYDWNQLAMAKELLDASFPVVEQNGTVFFVLVGGILRAKLEAELGSSKLAIELLDSLSTAENKQYPMTMRHCILDEKVRILLKSDDLISAQVALRSAGIDPEELGHINREELSIGDIAGLMAVSRVYVAEARYPQAIGILKELEADALNRERTRSWIGISALMSIAYWKSGNKSESANVLLKALEKSASISSVRSFLDIGTDILQPLRQVRKMYGKISREPSVVSFCSTLIQIFENEAAEKVDGSAVTNDAGSLTSLSVEQSELLEPLTERENEIAMLLADGMTNSRISRSLDVSTETIKWHLKNIYQKLGVSNRTQAVIALTGQRSFLGTPDQK
ncbi:MAG: LuxR C-terminal-related transcriptional regulator [Pseudomonadota bacterium]